MKDQSKTNKQLMKELAALRKERTFSEIIINSLPGIFYLFDENGNLMRWNRNFEIVSGYSSEEMEKMNPLDFFSGENKMLVGEAIQKVFVKGESHVEADFISKDKRRIPYYFTGLRFLSDNRPYLAGMGIDITERKRAEEALLEREEKMQSIFRVAPTGIGVVKNRILLDVNPRVCEMTGYAKEELVGKSSRIFYSAQEDFEYVGTEKYRQIAERGTGVVETKWMKKDGTVFDVLLASTPIDLNNLSKGAIFTALDISERKLAEEALRISEEKYRLLFENATDAIFVAQDEKVIFPNPQLSRLLGYSYEELNGALFRNFIHSDDIDMVVERHRKRLKGDNVPGTYSFRAVTKSGETLWVEVSNVLITWEGRPATLSFLRDITQQKKMEEQLLHAQKMEAIGTLAGGIAHDFNNLLMGILGYTSLMLMKTDKSHPFYEKLKIIEKQVESGAELTKQLLGFARGGKYEVKPVNVNDLLIKTADIFGRTKKEITIHKKLQEDLHTIEADRGQIEQVLFNLYVNAWQAMPSGGRLYLETQNAILDEQQCRAYDAKPGPYIKISVTDTGVGMDAETQKRIFEPFFSTKGLGKGTGLGLASAYGIIRNHGGIINVYSAKGHGTTFTLYLPASGAKAAEAKPNEVILLTGDETILIVDDEPLNIEPVKDLLEAFGYKIMTAQSGMKAIEIYREHSKDIKLVILDMIMPEMNGKETLVKLIEIDRNVCVLLSSGYSIEGEAVKILELGCKGFIQKPFRAEELSQKIRDTIDGNKH